MNPDSASASSSSAVSGSSISLNPKVFWSRVHSLYQSWKSAASTLNSSVNSSGAISLPLPSSASKCLGWGIPVAAFSSKDLPPSSVGVVDCILIVSGSGDSDDSSDYSRLLSIQFHLFGYEVPDSAILFMRDPDKILILTSPKKSKILAPLNADGLGGSITLELVDWNKADKSTGLQTLVRNARSTKGAKRIGELSEKSSSESGSSKAAERADSSFSSLVWAEFVSSGQFEFLDVSSGLGGCLLVKDATARGCISQAAELTTRALKKYLLPELETIIDEEKTVKQTELADAAEENLREPNKLGFANIKAEDVDSCYNPIIQSGGGVDFDLRPSAQTASINLEYSEGTSIIVQLGGRYRNYCANIGRTYFINPTEDQKEVYLLLSQIYIACKQSLKAGQKMSAIFNSAARIIQQSKKPELLEKFTKTVGFSIGLEFRESIALLNEKIHKLIQKGMVFNLSLGFSGLVNSAGKPYAVLLSDTLVINDDEPDSLTKMPREFKDIAYFIGDSANANDDAQAASELFEAGGGRATRRGGEETAANESSEKARADHQAELARKQRESAMKKLAASQADANFNSDEPEVDSSVAESYSSPSKFPPQAKRDRIFVDVAAESLLLPIGDLLVPFHISTVKNVHKQTENEFTYLRINFTVPDAKSLETKKFISELTYRTQGTSLDKVFFEIKELRKRVQNRQKELEAKSSLVAQDELRIDKRGGQIPILKDISVRPQLSRKKTVGTLAAHLNGLRFVSTDKLKVDIIYANIKAAFYQPAEESHQVLLHFELRDPILLDKSKTKKTNFVQFYVEVVEVSEDLSTVNRYRDEDGLLEEQEERKRRKRWNERFLNFVKEVEDKLSRAADEPGNSGIPRLEFDIPYRELAFTGVPGKSSVTLMPTVHSLVALEDMPPVVLTLGEVEIANFERVQFGLRNFDLTFVWKDFTRLPLRVDSIPIKFLDPLKHWLNSCDIVYYESQQNILWKNVMKAITEDIEEFWNEGGWTFLSNENDDGGGEGSDGEPMESGSEFEPSESDASDDSEEYETPSEEEENSEESEGEEDDEEEEEGEDWDELEQKAIKADRERGVKMKERGFDDGDDEENERPKKKNKK